MPLLTKPAAIAILRPHERELRLCVTRAWERWLELSSRFSLPTKRLRANAMHDLMVDEARARFADFETAEAENRFVVLLSEQAHVRFKKLGEDGLPRNYPTQGALLFEYQPELPGLLEPFARLTVGYRLDKAGTRVEAVEIVCQNGKTVEWRYEIPETRVAAPVRLKPALKVETSEPRVRTRSSAARRKPKLKLVRSSKSDKE